MHYALSWSSRSEYDMLGKALRVTNKVAHSLTHENALGLYVSTHT